MAIGSERVQPAKYESTAEGGKDADAGVYKNPTKIDPQEDAIESAGIYLQDATVRDENVYLARIAGESVSRDTIDTTPSPIQTTAKHKNLDTLLHAIAENNFAELTFTEGELTNVTTYTSAAKTEKIREDDLVYSDGDLSTYTSKQYSGGILVETISGNLSYTAGDLVSVTETTS